MPAAASNAPTGTRLALIEAGFRLFGAQGFSGTSIREIARQADTNVASIAYHFGGKDGLRVACAAEFVRRLRPVLDSPGPLPEGPEAARTLLRNFVARVARFALSSTEADAMVGFMLSELGQGGGALDRIYSGLFEPAHRRLCMIWALAAGQDADSETVRIAVFSMIGQIAYFRIARPLVLRRMDWAAMNDDHAGQVLDRLLINLDAILDARTAP